MLMRSDGHYLFHWWPSSFLDTPTHLSQTLPQYESIKEHVYTLRGQKGDRKETKELIFTSVFEESNYQ